MTRLVKVIATHARSDRDESMDESQRCFELRRVAKCPMVCRRLDASADCWHAPLTRITQPAGYTRHRHLQRLLHRVLVHTLVTPARKQFCL